MRLIDRLNRRRSRGAALVEMAIALLVLIPLTFGLLEFGWILFKLAQVNQAARAGVRTAVRPAADEAEVNAAIDSIMTGAGMGATGYDVTITDLTVAVGEPVEVYVEVDYATIELIGLVPTPEFLHGRATMAKEGPEGS